jgi:pyruvate kinase
VELIEELDRLQATETGIILKIENRLAVETLPRILLAAMARPVVAVMVARGDLGVEIGFEWLRFRKKSFGSAKPPTCQ